MELLAMAIVSGLIWAVTPSKTYYNTKFNQTEVTQEIQKNCVANGMGYIIEPNGFIFNDEVFYYKCVKND